MTTPDDIITEARTWLGTPFRHQGRVRGLGVDCAGLVIGVGNALALFGGEHVDHRAYGHSPHAGAMAQVLATHLDRVLGDDLRPGDVLHMRFDAEPQHLAIYTGETIIHSYAVVRKCVEHRLDDVWRARIDSVWRYRGIA